MYNKINKKQIEISQSSGCGYKIWLQSKIIAKKLEFNNDIKIVVSGSSSINIKQAKYDLSRRYVTYILHGLFFREFLNIKYGENYKSYDFHEIIENYYDIAFGIAENSKILLVFKNIENMDIIPFILKIVKPKYQ